MASKLICPLMTARVTSTSNPTDKSPTLTPTTVLCQEEGCAIWDSGNKACALLSIVMEAVKSVEAV